MRDVLQGFPGGSGGLVPGNLPQYLPQRINAGAFKGDPDNLTPVYVNKIYGTGPGSTYAIYPTLVFPQPGGNPEYWYVETSPPLNWTSTQVQFRTHFIVEDAVTLPGNFRFTLGVKRNQNATAPSGAKVTGNSDFALTGTTVPQKKISTISSVITVPSATQNDGLLLELTRGTAPSDDKNVIAYVIGIDLFFV